MTNIAAFLPHDKRDELFAQHSVICFTGSDYPLLFFSLFFSQLKDGQSTPVTTIDLSDMSLSTIKAHAQTSFLGMRSVYWLRAITDFDRSHQRDLIAYLREYHGPNAMALFIDKQRVPKTIPSHWAVVTVPETVDKKLFHRLLQFLAGTQSERFILDLFARYETINLDTACLLAQYAQVLGKNVRSFFDQWLDDIVLPESSLFTLSQYFFAKRSRSFFAQWACMHDKYVPQFWVTFWSEQLWRAYFFARLSRAGKRAEAKTIGYRLPFSYMQRDWRNYSLEQLRSAHQFVYDSDYLLKNGGTPVSLDLFFTKFFLNQFI